MSILHRLLCLPWVLLWALAGVASLRAQSAPPQSGDATVQPSPSRWGTETDFGTMRTRLTILDGTTLQRGRSVRARVELCNREPVPVQGRISILSTAAWQATPGRVFPFHLRDDTECFQQDFELSLLDAASPGPYDLVLRLEARGDELGTLRTRFMRPMEWLVIGPFASAAPSQPLPPEQGIHLEGSQPGLEGPVSWRRAQAWAYDATGALEVDLVLEAAPTRRCACAFTVFDLTESETLHWKAPGAERLLLDGRALEPGRAVRVTPGRHTLLARLCGTAGDWRLGFTVLRDDGSWPRNLENDLDRFLPGFGATWGTEDTTPTLRHVILQVRPGRARQVSVLGTFNSWIPWPLERAGDGTWKRDLFLPPGRHAYKLRIDGILTPDMAAERHEPDGFGGSNAVLIVR